MANHLTIVASQGLCNRMRVIDSAMSFAKEFNCGITVFWVNTPDLTAPPEALFEMGCLPKMIVVDNASEHLTPGKFDIVIDDSHMTDEHQQPSITQMIALHNSSEALILTCRRWYGRPQYRSRFIPIPEIQKRIDEFWEPIPKDAFMVGVHIRRTDHLWAINNSPIEEFVRKMRILIKNDPSTRFVVASDSRDDIAMLVHEFGERVHYFDVETNRITTEGLQQAVVELYSLSKTQMILGSHWSSFSHTAAEINVIPEATVYVR